MSDFRFGLGDRVNVPHFINVQGVVDGYSDHLNEGKKYQVSWVGGGMVSNRWFTAGEMAAANGPRISKAIEPAEVARAFELGQTAASAARNRKRKAAKKKAPKRKR